MITIKNIKGENLYFALIATDDKGKEDLITLESIFAPIDQKIKYTDMVKYGRHDGKHHFLRELNESTYVFKKGLKDRILFVANNKNIEIKDESTSFRNDILISRSDLEKFIKNNTLLKFTPYEHQIKGTGVAINNNRCILKAATGSGKSLIIFLYFLHKHLVENKRGLIVVPTSMLVDQLFSDFEDYLYSGLKSIKEKLKYDVSLTDEEREKLQFKIEYFDDRLIRLDEVVSKIYSGQDKFTHHHWKITTWQSIFNLDKASGFFDDVHCVIFDEVQKIKAESYDKISHNLIDCKERIGLTGTIPPDIVDSLKLEELTGKVVPIISSKELCDLGLATRCIVRPIILEYDKKTSFFIRNKKPKNVKSKWIFESTFLKTSKKRYNLICNIIINGISPLGNCVVLFKNTKSGRMIFDMIKSLGHENVVFIDGKIKQKDREEIRTKVDNHNDMIIVAQEKLMTTGINIKSLRSIVLADGGKSEVELIQSIGRTMRLFEGKSESYLFDFVDDLRGGYKTKNYYLKHYYNRLESYLKYEYEVDEPKIKKIDAFFDNDYEESKFLLSFKNKLS